jgi:hypothetical protein
MGSSPVATPYRTTLILEGKMETILGFVIFAVVLSAFYTGTSLLFYGYLIAILTTLGFHMYDCVVILVLASGSCQVYSDVITDVRLNMAAVSGAFVLAHTGLALIKKFTPRL